MAVLTFTKMPAACDEHSPLLLELILVVLVNVIIVVGIHDHDKIHPIWYSDN